MSDKIIFPDNRQRSPTAADDLADARNENIYSAIVATDNATGGAAVFSVPLGGQTAVLGTGAPVAHQLKSTLLVTNLPKAGEVGSSFGEFSIKAISITIEQAWYTTSGVINTYGAGLRETSELLAKTYFRFKIGGTKQIEGAQHMFPSHGGVFGGVSTAAGFAAVANNGWPGSSKKLRVPILGARQDTLEGEVAVAGSASLDFSNDPQPTLVWYNLDCLVARDLR
jgi:hypothetical protein